MDFRWPAKASSKPAIRGTGFALLVGRERETMFHTLFANRAAARVIRRTLGGLLSLALVTSCAPPPRASTSSTNASLKFLKAMSMSGLNANGDWACPSSPNLSYQGHVGNNGGYSYNGDGDFEVCASRANTPTTSQRFLISGTTSSSSICVYPAFASQTSDLEIVAQPQCFSVTESAIDVTFLPAAGKTVNYMIIVDVSYTQALDACLSGPTACPPRSEGFVN